MSLAQFLALVTGAVSEIILLMGNGNRNAVAHLGKAEGGIVPEETANPFHWLPDRRQVLAVSAVGMLLAITVAQFTIGNRLFEWIDIAFMYFIAGALAVVLFSAVLGDRMLPRVNEQQMLVIHLLVGVNILLTGTPSLPPPLLGLLIIPTALLLFQAAWPRVFTLTVRALLYLWYLVTLLTLMFQNGAANHFDVASIGPIEGYVIASLIIFLALHVLAALRFTLIVTSLLLPRNRPLLQLVLPRLFRDEQMPLKTLFAVIAIVALILVANWRFDIASSQMVVNLLVLGVAQFRWHRPI